MRAYIYALCVYVSTQGFVWKFVCAIYKFLFIHWCSGGRLQITAAGVWQLTWPSENCSQTRTLPLCCQGDSRPLLSKERNEFLNWSVWQVGVFSMRC